MKNIYSFIIVFAVLGLFMGCNGKQRPLTGGGEPTFPAGTGNSGELKNNGNLAGKSVQAKTNPANTASTNKQVVNNEAAKVGEGDGVNTVDQQQITFSEVQPLLQKHCVYCHVPGAPPTIPTIDWGDYATTKPYVDNGILYERMWTLREDEEKGMPLGNGFDMTEEERKKIVSWIQGGGLE